MDCELNADGPFQIRLAGTAIAWDGAYLAVGGNAYAVAPQVMRLRVLVDRTVVEVFADEGRLVATRVVYVEQRDCRVRISGSCQAEVVVLRLG